MRERERERERENKRAVITTVIEYSYYSPSTLLPQARVRITAVIVLLLRSWCSRYSEVGVWGERERERERERHTRTQRAVITTAIEYS